MLDLALFLFICFMLLAGLRRPYLWVLTYLYIDILAPQKIGWTITPAFQVSLIAFCAAASSDARINTATLIRSIRGAPGRVISTRRPIS